MNALVTSAGRRTSLVQAFAKATAARGGKVFAGDLSGLAPALYLPGYPTPAPAVLASHAEIVHGWDDAVIPCENAIRFARLRGCILHLVPGGHRLDTQIPLLCALFGAFLSRCAGAAGAKTG